MKREELIKKYIELSNLYDEKVELLGWSHYKEIDKIVIKRAKLGYKIEDCENFLKMYYEILCQYPKYLGLMGLRIRKFEPELAKKMSQKFYDMDREKNWETEFVLNHRDEGVERERKITDQDQLVKYEKRKEENPEEFTEIYNKINDFVDSL